MTEPQHGAAPERHKPEVPPMRDATSERPATPGSQSGGATSGNPATSGGAASERPAMPGTAAPDSPAVPATTGGAVPGGGTVVDPTSTGRHSRAGADRSVLKGTRISGLWVGITVAVVVLLLLLVFILQNNTYVTINFIGWSGNFPLGVALLLAAICGVLLVAVPTYARIIQLRRAARRAGRPK